MPVCLGTNNKHGYCQFGNDFYDIRMLHTVLYSSGAMILIPTTRNQKSNTPLPEQGSSAERGCHMDLVGSSKPPAPRPLNKPRSPTLYTNPKPQTLKPGIPKPLSPKWGPGLVEATAPSWISITEEFPWSFVFRVWVSGFRV